jgi:hypothetical protein
VAEIEGEMTWRDRLLKEAQSVVDNGEGKLELYVVPTGKDKTKVQVCCGSVWKFEIDKIQDD